MISEEHWRHMLASLCRTGADSVHPQNVVALVSSLWMWKGLRREGNSCVRDGAVEMRLA